MSKPLKKSFYQAVLLDIEVLYIGARRALGQAYWKIGRRIVLAEQQGSKKAPYGAKLIERLSEDLTAKFGSGFSKSNLVRIRRFYVENRIEPPAVQLPWTYQVELLSIKDPKRRKVLINKALNQKLLREDLREIIRSERRAEEPVLSKNKPAAPVKLSVTRSRLFTYKVIEPSYIHPIEERLVIDLGFNFLIQAQVKGIRLKQGEIIESTKTGKSYSFKHSDATPKELYTYKTLVERVVDADTIWLNIDLGFDCWIREKVRLRGIDAPEISTQKGQEAKKFVEARLKEVNFVVVKTHKPDKYERYLADIFYPPLNLRRAKEDNLETVLEQGVFLNQELLDNGLAEKM